MIWPHQQNGRGVVIQQGVAQLGFSHTLTDVALCAQDPLAFVILNCPGPGFRSTASRQAQSRRVVTQAVIDRVLAAYIMDIAMP